MRIGILAYGSLINDPKVEIENLTAERRSGIRTPFRIEFARSSKTRDGAPTLVPVDSGGSYVEAMLLILREGTTVEVATDILYRREINKVNLPVKYKPDPSKKDQVYIDHLRDVFGVDRVIYTRINPNIDSPTSDRLAELAIDSAREKAGKERRDGISYLIETKRCGIRTVLSDDYERKILEKTDSKTLEEAWKKLAQ